MGILMDDLTIAFAMQCDIRGLSYQEGVDWANDLADEFIDAAEDRAELLGQDE